MDKSGVRWWRPIFFISLLLFDFILKTQYAWTSRRDTILCQSYSKRLYHTWYNICNKDKIHLNKLIHIYIQFANILKYIDSKLIQREYIHLIQLYSLILFDIIVFFDTPDIVFDDTKCIHSYTWYDYNCWYNLIHGEYTGIIYTCYNCIVWCKCTVLIIFLIQSDRTYPTCIFPLSSFSSKFHLPLSSLFQSRSPLSSF